MRKIEAGAISLAGPWQNDKKREKKMLIYFVKKERENKYFLWQDLGSEEAIQAIQACPVIMEEDLHYQVVCQTILVFLISLNGGGPPLSGGLSNLNCFPFQRSSS